MAISLFKYTFAMSKKTKYRDEKREPITVCACNPSCCATKPRNAQQNCVMCNETTWCATKSRDAQQSRGHHRRHTHKPSSVIKPNKPDDYTCETFVPKNNTWRSSLANFVYMQPTIAKHFLFYYKRMCCKVYNFYIFILLIIFIN